MAKVTFEFRDNSKNCLNALGEELTMRMEEAVQIVRLNVLEKLSQQGTGRVYKVPGTKNTYYTASAPGEPPAVATGNLKQHIETDVIVSADTVEGEVGTEVEYGPMLEFGTMKMLPRPWLRPSFEESDAEIKDILQVPMEIEIE